ncbi:hypothetical protein A2U01_0085037, partial [Trifolium medium]|nr:hypothetical protein [Trifolium medium]
MRLMKAEGKIITGADIAKAPVDDKKRKRTIKVKQETTSEEKTSGNMSSSGAGASEIKGKG